MVRQKMVSINVSSKAILRTTFALEFRIYQKKSLEKPSFRRKKAIFLHLASNTRIKYVIDF